MDLLGCRKYWLTKSFLLWSPSLMGICLSRVERFFAPCYHTIHRNRSIVPDDAKPSLCIKAILFPSVFAEKTISYRDLSNCFRKVSEALRMNCKVRLRPAFTSLMMPFASVPGTLAISVPIVTPKSAQRTLLGRR
ncbi:hypothetical protein BKA82DRAFT_770884 [Pisolithus tinctorius]|uniref:Uncharacterized protein n=1 Tax=Pisolithus tinctorius Marx 270 TaxID=870435 RepID=A0A0C3NXU3_PISTI|nr:hypothetical protein BKA82DRAFT_770884 [Pisolithus tinctorius]KIO00156.1 hypothetical protein M404DRAFT_770884 [Pisolithus tinctorius Marx 270]